MSAEELVAEAVRTLYRDYREQESPTEAMYDALNTAKVLLDRLAGEQGFQVDIAEYPESALDTEYVTEEEFLRRPEACWFSFAKRIGCFDLDDDEVLDEARRFRRLVEAQGGILPERPRPGPIAGGAS